MLSHSRIRSSRLLTVLTIVGGSLLGGSVTFAQSPPQPTFAPPDADADQPVTGPPQISPGGTITGPQLLPPGQTTFSPVVPPVDRPDYWIVSSRRSPQVNAARAAASPLQYFRVNQSPRNPQTATRDEFRASFAPGEPVCVIVHGSFTGWSDILAEGRRMVDWLRGPAPDCPTRFVVFTWPSDGPTTVLPAMELNALGIRSAFNGMYLVRTIDDLPPGSPVCLLGHSHGARSVVAATHLLGGGGVQGYQLDRQGRPNRRIRLVLTAAALDHHWLNPGERYERALPTTEFLLNVRNQFDFPLRVYSLRRPFSHEALGSTGFTRLDRHLLGANSARIGEIDVTTQVQSGHFWDHYYRNEGIARAIAPVVHFNDAHSLARRRMSRVRADVRPITPVSRRRTVPRSTTPSRAVFFDQIGPLRHTSPTSEYSFNRIRR